MENDGDKIIKICYFECLRILYYFKQGELKSMYNYREVLSVLKKESDFISGTIERCKSFCELIINDDEWLEGSEMVVGWLKMIALSSNIIQLNLVNIVNKKNVYLLNEMKQVFLQLDTKVVRAIEICQKLSGKEMFDELSHELSQMKDTNFVEFCNRIDVLQGMVM